MLEDLYRGEDAPIDDLEFVKGCPACEHPDSELERELKALARLLFDIYLEARGLYASGETGPR
jgi:hypothetical protein